jgi:hypothetical protein
MWRPSGPVEDNVSQLPTIYAQSKPPLLKRFCKPVTPGAAARTERSSEP